MSQVLLILWLAGFCIPHSGSLIHLLVVKALVIFVIDLLGGCYRMKKPGGRNEC
jgi:hypothetical protein